MKTLKHPGIGPLKAGATEESMQTKSTPHQPFKEVVFGARPVLEALESGQEINKILVLRGAQGENAQLISTLARKRNIPLQKVPMEKLNKVTRKNHQGIIALLSPIQYDDLEVVVPSLYENGINPLILVLDQITDVRNLGAICRSAECMGVQAVVIPGRGGAMINSDAIKTSAGAIFNLKVCRVDSLEIAVSFLKNSGLQIAACSEKGNTLLHDAQFNNPTALILGAEDTGIAPELIKHTDRQVRIPMSGKTQSLNVAVSAGIVLYECIKQRSLAEKTV